MASGGSGVMDPFDVTEKQITELVIECASRTRWSHTWWDSQVRTLITSGMFSSWAEIETLGRECARGHIPPVALLPLLHGGTDD